MPITAPTPAPNTAVAPTYSASCFTSPFSSILSSCRIATVSSRLSPRRAHSFFDLGAGAALPTARKAVGKCR